MPTFVNLRAEPWAGLLARLAELGQNAGQGALYVAVAAVVMLVGWAAAALLAALVRGILRALRFDAAAHRVFGLRSGTAHEPAALAGWAVYWLVLAGAASLALETLGFKLGASVAARLVDVIPRIVACAVIFAVGALVSLLLGAIMRRFLTSAGVRTARLQGQIVSAILIGFSALLALEQLGFAAQFVMALGVVAVAAAGLALALAFGLGCRDLARDFLVEYLRSLDDEGAKRPQ